MISIPLSTDSLYSQVTTLSGQDFILGFAWNAREGAWYLDIADQDGAMICPSRKIVVGFPLITRCVDPRRPLGLLMAVDSSGAAADPGRNDLGSRVKLVYYDPSELAP